VLDAQGELANRHANLVLLILENLLHNALKVTPRGGIVRLHLAEDREHIRCEVADGGPGVSAEMRPRLFLPCRSTHGGSGLGLAISKQLAGQIGAELQLQSTSAAGAVFALLLPRRLFAEAEHAETGAAPATRTEVHHANERDEQHQGYRLERDRLFAGRSRAA
jgi:two-component system sensor histidine kinase TctE